MLQERSGSLSNRRPLEISKVKLEKKYVKLNTGQEPWKLGIVRVNSLTRRDRAAGQKKYLKKTMAYGFPELGTNSQPQIRSENAK